MAEKAYFGEGKNIEFKREIPQKHERFLKDIIAFSNCTGGKVILGIEDTTNIVYGIGEANPFKLSDDISTMISDACTPQIETNITMQTFEGKTVLVIDVAPGRFRPYYLKSAGKETSAYIRINGTSRAADVRRLQELKIIEAWGTGLGRIRNSCREYGLKEPTIEEFGDGFRVIFYRKAGSDIESGTETKNSGTESVTKSQPMDIESDIENRLCDLIIQYPTITQQAAAEKLGYSKSWIRRIMKKMQQEGTLCREGSTKKGSWIVMR